MNFKPGDVIIDGPNDKTFDDLFFGIILKILDDEEISIYGSASTEECALIMWENGWVENGRGLKWIRHI